MSRVVSVDNLLLTFHRKKNLFRFSREKSLCHLKLFEEFSDEFIDELTLIVADGLTQRSRRKVDST